MACLRRPWARARPQLPPPMTRMWVLGGEAIVKDAGGRELKGKVGGRKD